MNEVNPSNKYIFIWESLGIVFVFLKGALLHFVFEWSGESLVVGLFAPVNESVWEHFKLGFLPMLVYGAIEFQFLRKVARNFFTAKAAAVYAIPIVIGLIFYAYTAVFGREILIVDILIFLLAVIAGQSLSYKIMTSFQLPQYAGVISIVLIVLLAGILILFTLHPPHLPIFQDGRGFYGIP